MSPAIVHTTRGALRVLRHGLSLQAAPFQESGWHSRWRGLRQAQAAASGRPLFPRHGAVGPGGVLASMKNLFGVLSVVAAATPLRAEDGNPGPIVNGLPLHLNYEEEVRHLEGPRRLAKGELVFWNYGFPWVAFSATGRKLHLNPAPDNRPMRYVGRDATGWKVCIGGVQHVINYPPYSGAGFCLAEINVADLTIAVTMNRLGQPTRTTREGQNSVLLFYCAFAEVRITNASVESVTRGRVSDGSARATTVTTESYTEKRAVPIYHFTLTFGPDGRFLRVADLWNGPTRWVRGP